jgi:hypothetical protein
MKQRKHSADLRIHHRNPRVAVKYGIVLLVTWGILSMIGSLANPGLGTLPPLNVNFQPGDSVVTVSLSLAPSTTPDPIDLKVALVPAQGDDCPKAFQSRMTNNFPALALKSEDDNEYEISIFSNGYNRACWVKIFVDAQFSFKGLAKPQAELEDRLSFLRTQKFDVVVGSGDANRPIKLLDKKSLPAGQSTARLLNCGQNPYRLNADSLYLVQILPRNSPVDTNHLFPVELTACICDTTPAPASNARLSGNAPTQIRTTPSQGVWLDVCLSGAISYQLTWKADFAGRLSVFTYQDPMDNDTYDLLGSLGFFPSDTSYTLPLVGIGEGKPLKFAIHRWKGGHNISGYINALP